MISLRSEHFAHGCPGTCADIAFLHGRGRSLQASFVAVLGVWSNFLRSANSQVVDDRTDHDWYEPDSEFQAYFLLFQIPNDSRRCGEAKRTAPRQYDSPHFLNEADWLEQYHLIGSGCRSVVVDARRGAFLAEEQNRTPSGTSRIRVMSHLNSGHISDRARS